MDQQETPLVPLDHRLPASIPSPKPRRRWFWVVAVTILLLLVALALHHHRKKKRSTEQSNGSTSGPIAVTPVTAKTGDIGVYLTAIGTVTPVYTDSITSQVTGVIKSVYYREGQFVRKGDPLIDIDQRPFAALVAEAKGTLERDQNVLAQAQMDLERYRGAWGRNAISRQQLEDQEKVALQDQGLVDYDKGALQYAEVQLNYCHIVAPITGRVGLRLVDPGNLVTANATTSLVVITQLSPITVIFTLAEDSLSQVLDQMSHGQRLTVEAYDRSQEKLLETGTLSTVDNQIDTTTGTVKLRATFPNPQNTLFPNEFVNTRLLITTLRSQTLIPTSAIQHNGDAAFVYVLQDNKSIARNIHTGVSDRGNTAVRGVNPGEVIANSSFEKLQNGTAITISSMALPSTSSDVNEAVEP